MLLLRCCPLPVVHRSPHERRTMDNTQRTSPTRCLNLDVDARGKAQFVERFDRLGRGLDDIDQTLVRANLELLP